MRQARPFVFGSTIRFMSSTTTQAGAKNYLVAHLPSLEPTRCPCGWARRAFGVEGNTTATVHLVEILEDSRAHYHKRMTEIYVVLEGHGHLELDGERIAVAPLSTVMIRPGCRHRAVGKLKILNVPIPAFDPDDEYFD